MDLSIGVPSIRPYNLSKLYNSIDFKGEWEMIIVSPFPLPESLKDKSNIKYINDWGSPVRCQQISLVESTGKFYSWAADDSVYKNGSLDKAMSIIDKDNYKSVVMGKYTESDNIDSINFMNSDVYYLLHTHQDCRKPSIPGYYKLLNAGLLHTQVLKEIGGWDCRFEVGGMCFVDLAVRLQNYRCEFINLNDIMLICGHMPGLSGDHAPISYAQQEHDQPLFDYIYSDIGAIERVFVDLDYWKKCPERWERRFPKHIDNLTIIRD